MDRMRVRRCIWLGLGFVACAGDLPIAERIASVRPLAVRSEVIDPAAMPDEAVRAEAMPLENVRLVPLIADPQGPWSAARIAAELDPVWIACTMEPAQGVFGCITAARPLDPADLPECPPIDPTAFDPSDPELASRPSPCTLAVADPGAPELIMPIDPAFLLGGDLEVTMIGHRPDEGSTAACLEAVLADDGDPDEGCLIVSQRVSVGPDGRLLELAQELGLPVDRLPPPPDPIPDPDRNPRILEMRVAVFHDPKAKTPDEALVVERGTRLQLPAGARIEVEIDASEDDLQTFAIPGDDGEYGTRDEDYAGDWYRTWGALLAPNSDDPQARNTWTLVPGEQDDDDDDTGLPPDGVATLLYVLRDGRAGVEWTWLQVEVVPAPM
jgi:hypothetical protein